MAETTCPSLVELGIQPGSFIRKIDNQNHWNAYVDNIDLSFASKQISEKLFYEQESIYSLWQVSTEQELYGVVASLTTNANPKDRNIDFIWMSEAELEAAGIQFKKKSEGKCLQVKDLHFNATIPPIAAQRLCHNLLIEKRVAKRCKKVYTTAIREYQNTLGCKAVDDSSPKCRCEE